MVGGMVTGEGGCLAHIVVKTHLSSARGQVGRSSLLLLLSLSQSQSAGVCRREGLMRSGVCQRRCARDPKSNEEVSRRVQPPGATVGGGEGKVPARALQVNNKIPLCFVSHPNTIARRPDGRRAVGDRRRLPLSCSSTCRTPAHMYDLYLYKLLLLYRAIRQPFSPQYFPLMYSDSLFLEIFNQRSKTILSNFIAIFSTYNTSGVMNSGIITDLCFSNDNTLSSVVNQVFSGYLFIFSCR